MLRALRSVVVLLPLAISLVIGSAGQQLYTDVEAHVSDLPLLRAKSEEPTDVLAASLETILHDRTICCGRDSALEDSLAHADPGALKDIASKLQGRHLLSDGRPIAVTAEFWPVDSVNGATLITSFSQRNALLLLWDSHLYVVHGVVYRWVVDGADGVPYPVIRQMLLWDARYSDSRREVVFNRETEDTGKLQGFLFLTFSLS